ncbi:hypothetical protein PMIN03_006869 [Paraphaeosphaeria minitans]
MDKSNKVCTLLSSRMHLRGYDWALYLSLASFFLRRMRITRKRAAPAINKTPMETPAHIPIHDPVVKASRFSGATVGEETCDVLMYGWMKVYCVVSELWAGGVWLIEDVRVFSSVLRFCVVSIDAEGPSVLHAIVRTMRVCFGTANLSQR